MADRSQQHQPVISIRISEELRERLDKLKKMMALRSGENVSTSEAAKQLLESAKDDRIEVVGLLLQPTESLLRVRKKLEARLTLSQAEWALIAYYCTQGAESFASTEQGQLSYESWQICLKPFSQLMPSPQNRRECPWNGILADPSRGQAGGAESLKR